MGEHDDGSFFPHLRRVKLTDRCTVLFNTF